MKQKLGEEYLNRTKSILKTVEWKNTTKAVSTFGTAVLTVSCGIVKWTATDLEKLQPKIGTLLTIYISPPCCKERLTVPQQMGGRGLID